MHAAFDSNRYSLIIELGSRRQLAHAGTEENRTHCATNGSPGAGVCDQSIAALRGVV
jgi:hypothetical protein